MKAYYYKNREAVLLRAAKYREKNRLLLRKKNRKYYDRKLREAGKIRRVKLVPTKEDKRIYSRAYYARTVERRASSRAYRAKNLDAARERCRIHAMKKRNGIFWETKEIILQISRAVKIKQQKGTSK